MNGLVNVARGSIYIMLFRKFTFLPEKLFQHTDDPKQDAGSHFECENSYLTAINNFRRHPAIIGSPSALAV